MNKRYCLIFVILCLFSKSEKLLSIGIERGLIVYGNYSCIGSQVSTIGFPSSNQLMHKYGLELEYKHSNISPILAVNFHEVLYSTTNGFISYRGFSGYNVNLGIQKEVLCGFENFKSVGGVFSCLNYDRFNLTQQYEIYPSLLVRYGYTKYNTLNFSRIPTAFFIPFEYAFRQSGNYFSLGLTVQLGFKI
jgi:hypothetical protein